MALPTARTPQSVNSKTFTAPPPLSLDLALPELYDWHHKHSAQHPLYVYVDDATDQVTTLPWGTAVQGIYRIAHLVVERVKELKSSELRPTIGLCSTSDPLTYLLSMLGIMRAGYPLFLISAHTSPATLKHLIKISGVQLVLANTDDDAELNLKLATAVAELALDSDGGKATIAPLLSWSQIFSRENVYDEGPAVTNYDSESAALILHSSGSTTLPRLNVWTHRMITTSLWQPWYGAHDICGEIMSVASVPLSGAGGAMLTLFPASSGLVVSALQPKSPPTQTNATNVWQAIVATKSTYAFIRHPFLYMFAEDPAKCSIMAQLNGVFYGGGPVRKLVGDQLARQGVRLVPFFGSSEAGLMNEVFPNPKGTALEDWEFFPFWSFLSLAFVPQENSELFELVIKSGALHKTTQVNTTYEGVPAFATGDLLLPHPTKGGLWKYVGRVDDQVTLPGNGLKVNAVAFEMMLASDPLIRGAVIFCQGATFGVIVDPVPEYAARCDLSVAAAAEKLRALIWPTIEKFNQLVPVLARLKKEIILFSTPEKPFVYGEKGLPRRKAAIQAYVPEIEASVGAWSGV
ncbi:hypothetical protein C8R46DRAFT_1185874 [Mycena filopes]|nr:hypothetical protein C8R46DRAFT_1185874 [Mycena filopes]